MVSEARFPGRGSRVSLQALLKRPSAQIGAELFRLASSGQLKGLGANNLTQLLAKLQRPDLNGLIAKLAKSENPALHAAALLVFEKLPDNRIKDLSPTHLGLIDALRAGQSSGAADLGISCQVKGEFPELGLNTSSVGRNDEEYGEAMDYFETVHSEFEDGTEKGHILQGVHGDVISDERAAMATNAHALYSRRTVTIAVPKNKGGK